MVPAEQGEEKDEAAMKKWSCEPQELQALLDTYVVETRFSGRHPTTSLYLVQADRRSGETVAVTSGQKYKLFLAPCLELK